MNNSLIRDLDTTNRIKNLQSEILQDVIDAVLCSEFSTKWPEELYKRAKMLEEKSNNKCISKSEDKELGGLISYIKTVESNGGIEYASKNAIDTTLAFQIVKYCKLTCHYFNWGTDFHDRVRALKDGRNSISHKLDTIFRNPTEEQKRFYYSLCIVQVTELFAFVECMKKSDKFNLLGKNELLESFVDKIALLEKEIGDTLGQDYFEEVLLKEYDRDREFDLETKDWLRKEVQRIYGGNPTIGGKQIGLFEKAIKTRLIDINYSRILPYVRDDYENVSSFFTDASIEVFILSLSEDEIEPKSAILKYEEGLTKDIAKIYKTRNRCEQGSYEYIVLTIAILLNICEKYKDRIIFCSDEKDRRSALDIYSYADKVITDMDNKSYIYVNIPWMKNNRNSEQELCSIDEIIDNVNPVRLCGEAGCGKSTAMKQISYHFAQKTLDDIDVQLPVYVELHRIVTGNDIFDEIKCILGIEREDIFKFIEYNEIVLLLDGYDEIQDVEAKKRFSRDIDDIHQKYPKLRLFISDRYTQGGIPILNGASQYLFAHLGLDRIKMLIENYCNDNAAMDLLNEKLVNDPGYFILYNTPLKIVALANMAKERHILPATSNEFVGIYFDALKKREENEKKNINMEYVEPCICALSLIENGVSQFDAEYQIGKLLYELHYTRVDSKEILRVIVGMGILNNIDDTISFASQEYRDYFFGKCLQYKLDLKLSKS